MSLIERLRERSITWDRAEYEQLQEYWMESVKDGHKAADRIEELEAEFKKFQYPPEHRVSVAEAESRRLERRIAELEAENKCLKKQKQIAIDALFSICQSDWGIGHSLAKPAHKAIKELAAVERKNDE